MQGPHPRVIHMSCLARIADTVISWECPWPLWFSVLHECILVSPELTFSLLCAPLLLDGDPAWFTDDLGHSNQVYLQPVVAPQIHLGPHGEPASWSLLQVQAGT